MKEEFYSKDNVQHIKQEEAQDYFIPPIPVKKH